MHQLRNVIAFCTVLVGALHAPAAFAAPRVFALFVGVAEYRYSKPKTPRGTLEDLGGAPNDIAALKATIEPRLQIARSVTLLNQEATRVAILAAFNQLVDTAAPGDTLLFYYTGHGARIFDQSGKQLSGYSSTIVPYDARDPALPASRGGDILDNELRDLIAAASGLGVNVVTIFDSCNSGTATRSASPWIDDGTVRLRGAPDLVVTQPLAQPDAPLVLPHGKTAAPAQRGYTVHLAAAPDGKAAVERVVESQWRGDFTEALVRSLNELPESASYRELLQSVRMKLRQRLSAETTTRVMTDIRGEGDLDQRFLGQWSPVRLLEGERSVDGTWTLAAGSVAGITRGSRYTGYASGSDARDPKAAGVASGVVTVVEPGTATITLDKAAPSASTMPGKLFWRETAHGAGSTRLRIKVAGGDKSAQASVDAQLAGLAFVRATSGNPDIVVDLAVPGRIRVVRAEDDSTVTTLGLDEKERLRAVLEQIARYHSLLAMIGQGTPLNVQFALSDTYCDGSPGTSIDYQGGEAHFRPGVAGRDSFVLVLRNNETRALYPHIINLSAGYEVGLVATAGDNAKEDMLEPGRCWNWPATVNGQGRDWLLLVLADRPLPGLQMLSAGAIRGGPESEDPLATLIFDAAGGRQTRGEAPPGIWSVRAVSYVIEGETIEPN